MKRYDQVPYDSKPVLESHPDRLAVVAGLFGMDPVPVARARILELGGAEGGNLLPIALTYPTADCVNIDYSPVQVAYGNQAIQALGLENYRVICADILDLPPDLGTFDYVIAHGVYSWVPAPVRQALLQAIHQLLRPTGVAMVSYNTYPGWYSTRAVREMMQYHAAKFDSPEEQIAQSRALLEFLVEATPPKSVYGQFLRREADGLGDFADQYIYHEHLEPVNEPVWFHEFISHAKAAGLQYLGESDFGRMLIDLFPDPAVARLVELDDPLEVEQYMDLLSFRSFRCTLLTASDVSLPREVAGSVVKELRISADAFVTDDRATLDDRTPVNFQLAHERRGQFSFREMPLKAAMVHLCRIRPSSVTFPELVIGVETLLQQSLSDADQERMAGQLLQAYARQVIDLHRETDTFVREPGTHPTVSKLVQVQARSGFPYVSSQRHRPIRITVLDGVLLVLLDGTRDRDELVEAVAVAVEEGRLQLDDRLDVLTRQPAGLRVLIHTEVARKLTFYGQMALLIA